VDSSLPFEEYVVNDRYTFCSVKEYWEKHRETLEDGTSRVCAYHGCEVVREPRGLVRCPCGHALHSDVNAALNILKRAEALGIPVRVPKRVKVLSFTPTPSGGGKHADLERATPTAPRRRRGKRARGARSGDRGR